ncbi:ATP-grasp domain-containing protein [Streptomyces sp. NPDC003011]
MLTEPPTWELAYTAGHTVVAHFADVDGLVRVARAVAAGRALDGVICWDETWIEQTAQVAAALGLPGGDRRCVERCRDKHRTRAALDAGRVPQPRSVLVSGREEALAVAEGIGYPVVLKPRALTGNFGVVRADSPTGLVEAVEFTGASGESAPDLPTHERIPAAALGDHPDSGHWPCPAQKGDPVGREGSPELDGRSRTAGVGYNVAPALRTPPRPCTSCAASGHTRLTHPENRPHRRLGVS